MSTKKCTGPCGETKAVEQFSWRNRAKGKRKSRCKVCRSADAKKHYEDNREAMLAWQQQHYEANRDAVRAHQQQYREENRDEINARRRTPEARALANAAANARRSTPQGKLLNKIRKLHRCFYKGIRLGPVTTQRGEALVGCTRKDYRDLLASQFKPGMTHENHGRGSWQIDHIIPKAAFKGELEANLQMIYWYGNAQPLWGPDNTAKGGKYTAEGKQSLITKYHEWVAAGKPPPVNTIP
mgnify:CR=1 FL=1